MNIALDQLATDFHVGLSVANWLVLGFTVVTATVIIVAVSLLKRFGVRWIMPFGYGAALVGSLLGFLAWNFETMFATRLVQALTVGLFFPVVTSVILAIAPTGSRPRCSPSIAASSAWVWLSLRLWRACCSPTEGCGRCFSSPRPWPSFCSSAFSRSCGACSRGSGVPLMASVPASPSPGSARSSTG